VAQIDLTFSPVEFEAAGEQPVQSAFSSQVEQLAGEYGNKGEVERIPIGWNHPIDKNTLKINLLEHVLIGKVSQLFRNML
jgi:hypothetical protein